MIIRRVISRIACIFILYIQSINGQNYNSDNIALINFLVRMYHNAPFEGVRIIEDYNDRYLLSILTLDKTKYPNESMMNRVASVKAMSQANRFFNGSDITSELIIRISEKSDGTSGDVETIEKIREHSVGYVKALEQLTNFSDESGRQVFIFYKRIDN